MQVNGQNIQQPKSPQPQYNSNYNCQCAPVAPECNVQQQSLATNPVQNQYPAGYMQPQTNIYPQYQQQAQNLQVPSTAAGVNIQIFNPSVSTPGAQPPTYNVNAPCYPASYYTGSVGADGKLRPNGQGGDNNGYSGGNSNSGTINGNVNTGTNNGTIGNNNNNTNTTTTTYNNTNNTSASDDKKKTEKRKIVELTDDYIRNLEAYLDSQDKSVRLNAAKEVYARLEEDDSRKDDKALNALINKMLQDPSQEIRFLALTALDGRIVTGDEYTIGVLQNIQKNSNDALNQEAAEASSILLKMSSRQVEKEFEVKNDKVDKKEDSKGSKKA